MLSLASRVDGWQPPTVKTVATTGQGVVDLVQALDQFRSFSERAEVASRRREEHLRSRLLDLLRQTLFERALAGLTPNGLRDRYVADLLTHKRHPHEVVAEIVTALFAGEARSGGTDDHDGAKVHMEGVIDPIAVGVVARGLRLHLARQVTLACE